MHFGEYELSPSLISLSPLPTRHPKIFQHLPVRPSSWCYPTFSLHMGRSLGFASTPSDLNALFRLAFASAPWLNHLTLPEKVTRRFIMQKARRHPIQGSDRLQADGFRVYFTPLFEVLFTFPSRYWFTIGLSEVFSLAGWAPPIHTGFLVSRATQDTAKLQKRFVYGIITLSDYSFQNIPLRFFLAISQSYNPDTAKTAPVWAVARSLATTCAITFVFFSCGYLDVSVPHVRLRIIRMVYLQYTGLPHSEIHGSMVICTYPWLIAAYHVLHRLREPRHPPSALAYFLFLS